MLTYVYIGSVGPFENVYVNKKKKKNFSLFHFSTFELWCFSIYVFSGMTKIDFHQYCPIHKIQEDASNRKIEELHGTYYKKLSIEKWKNQMLKSEKVKHSQFYFFVYVNIFKRTHGPYVNIRKHFADHLPTLKCKRKLWRLPNMKRFRAGLINVPLLQATDIAMISRYTYLSKKWHRSLTYMFYEKYTVSYFKLLQETKVNGCISKIPFCVRKLHNPKKATKFQLRFSF